MDGLGRVPQLGMPELIILAFVLVFVLAPLVLTFYGVRALLRRLRQ